MLARDPSPPPLPAEGPIVAEPARGNESYIALVWRRLKRSWTGMAGLWLVVLLLLMAVFAEFIAPMDPKVTDVGFAPPQVP
ncbi:MAG: ABC transporter permease, partial [Mesorhizobium sp.]